MVCAKSHIPGCVSADSAANRRFCQGCRKRMRRALVESTGGLRMRTSRCLFESMGWGGEGQTPGVYADEHMSNRHSALRGVRISIHASWRVRCHGREA